MGCVHINIHPGRIDGSFTVCLDCKHLVNVQNASYASGTTEEEQYEKALKQLEALSCK